MNLIMVLFTISAGVDKNRLIESVQAILEECENLYTKPISRWNFKTKISGNLFLGLESSDAIAEYAGMQEIMRRR